jgi:hypothetical protein
MGQHNVLVCALFLVQGGKWTAVWMYNGVQCNNVARLNNHCCHGNAKIPYAYC